MAKTPLEKSDVMRDWLGRNIRRARRWVGNNKLTTVVILFQAIVAAYGSLSAGFDALKSIGLQIPPALSTSLVGGTALLGSILIYLNEYNKAVKRRKLGEPDGRRGEVLLYSERYLLPKLHDAASDATSVSILGKNLFYWAIIDPETIRDLLSRGKTITMLMVDPKSEWASKASDLSANRGQEVKNNTDAAYAGFLDLRAWWELARKNLHLENRFVLKIFDAQNNLSFVLFDEGMPSARIQKERHSPNVSTAKRSNEMVALKDDSREYWLSYSDFEAIMAHAKEVP